LSCSADKIGPFETLGEEYFPLITGNYVIYQVDQTLYELGNPVSSSYQLKESVVDSFANNAGGYIYLLQRELWNEVEEQWENFEVWSARTTETEAVIMEGNTPFFKLKFPLRIDQEWDGNLYNNMAVANYRTDSVAFPYDIDAQSTIDNSITIVQSNNQDRIVETDYRIEKYAPHIGLIYKEILNLEYCTSSNDCLGQQIIDSGLKYKQAIIAFGDE
jgi:hypothetical protein